VSGGVEVVPLGAGLLLAPPAAEPEAPPLAEPEAAPLAELEGASFFSAEGAGLDGVDVAPPAPAEEEPDAEPVAPDGDDGVVLGEVA
jgi:hypothetical protein